MSRQLMRLVVALVLLSAGCSSIPDWDGDVAADLKDVTSKASPDRAKLGKIAIAPIGTISLSANEAPRGWKPDQVFDRAQLQKDIQKGLVATSSYERVRLGATRDFGEAFRERDDLVANIDLENVHIEFSHNGWWVPNIVNWLFWIVPAWFVATEEYTLAMDARVSVTSGDSGTLLKSFPVSIKSTGSFDEFDRGWQFFGFIYPSNDEENWRAIATRLMPNARRALASGVARQLETELRGTKFSDMKTMVLAVGLTRYEDPNYLPPLQFAAQDATAITDGLRRVGVNPDHMLALTDAGASVAAFKAAVTDHLSRARDNDLTVVYFAGYGSRDQNGKPQLLFHDATKEGGRIDAEALANLLDGVKGRKLLIIDASFDGQGRSVKGGAATANDLAALDRPSLSVLLATSNGEAAVSPEYLGHGMLTFHLLEGLAGPADSNRDGRISADELFTFARERVIAESAMSGAPMTPRAIGTDRFVFESAGAARTP